jgi:hypothetical protein
MSDNNGNLLKQQIYVPGHQMRWQQYDYDSLNRLSSAREVLDGGAEQWKQQFIYDRWGNRTINTAVTYGAGINNKAFTVNTANNRLGVLVQRTVSRIGCRSISARTGRSTRLMCSPYRTTMSVQANLPSR